MRNLLLSGAKSMPYFTDMRAIFDALPGACGRYDWLISDLDWIWLSRDKDDGSPDKSLVGSTVLISGEELLKIIQSSQIQFVWAVFSALPKGVEPRLDERNLPFAEGNPDLWSGSPKPQLAEALFEIVCWDSTETLLIGLDDDSARSFKEAFPTAVDLDDYNQQLVEPPQRAN
jgi:hypothetical protein